MLSRMIKARKSLKINRKKISIDFLTFIMHESIKIHRKPTFSMIFAYLENIGSYTGVPRGVKPKFGISNHREANIFEGEIERGPK